MKVCLKGKRNRFELEVAALANNVVVTWWTDTTGMMMRVFKIVMTMDTLLVRQ
jgi:hypothetical protein